MSEEVKVYEGTLRVYVNYKYYEGCKGCFTLHNGDPGYPPEPPEVEVLSIRTTDDASTLDITNMLPIESLEAIQEELIRYEQTSKEAKDD